MIAKQMPQDTGIFERGQFRVQRAEIEQNELWSFRRQVKPLIQTHKTGIRRVETLKHRAWTIIQLVENRVTGVLPKNIHGAVADNFTAARQLRGATINVQSRVQALLASARFQHAPEVVTEGAKGLFKRAGPR